MSDAQEIEDTLEDEKIIQQAVLPMQGYEDAPVPYDENKVKKEVRNWVDDYGDQVIPDGKGFLTDFVYHTRGYMIPTLACIWSGLFLLSTAIKREAWLKWMPNSLYANLYMIIIGSAGRAKKTTAITQVGYPILTAFRNYIRDSNLFKMKYISVTKDMTTPEYVIDSMLPENKPIEQEFFLVGKQGEQIKDSRGKAVQYKRTSETAIVSSELSTFLSSRSYSDSMSSLMLDLYDCHDTFDWGTLSRGKKTLRKLYTSFVAGTTVTGLRDSIPRAAKGDGFLSRTILVYVPASKRKYSMPREATGCPSTLEMARRLAWVAEHTIGEFTLSPAAYAEYEIWYDWFYRKMEDNPTMEGAISRMDVHLLKTAMLIRASRYDAVGQTVELQDLKDAIRLIDATYATLPFLLSQLDPDEITVLVSKTEHYIRSRKKVTRGSLLSGLRIQSMNMNIVLEELAARGVVSFAVEDRESKHSTGRSNEIITWIGGQDDGAGDFAEVGCRPDFSYTQEIQGYQGNGRKARGVAHRAQTVL